MNTYEVQPLRCDSSDGGVFRVERDAEADMFGVYRYPEPDHYGLSPGEWLIDVPTREAAETYAALMREEDNMHAESIDREAVKRNIIGDIHDLARFVRMTGDYDEGSNAQARFIVEHLPDVGMLRHSAQVLLDDSDDRDHYAMHLGVIGGVLAEDERAKIERVVTPVDAAHADGDNFHEWGEPFSTDEAGLNTVASRSGHVVLHVQRGWNPADVFMAVQHALPGRVFCTATHISETGGSALHPDPWVVTSIADWSEQSQNGWR